MGDHSKSSINTMFNTGTVVGVGQTCLDLDSLKKFYSFIFMGRCQRFSIYDIEKALLVAEKVCNRRDIKISDLDKQILFNI